MSDKLPNANDRVYIIRTGELGTIDTDGVPQIHAGRWQFFVRLDAGAEGKQWRGWFWADELEVVANGPASDPAAYVDPPELDEHWGANRDGRDEPGPVTS